MKVLLIQPPYPFSEFPKPSSALLSLGTLLKKEGVEVEILDLLSTRYAPEKIEKRLARFQPEVIGEAKNGQEVVELYAQLKPDLVTMDIVMPVLEGIEAIKRIMNFDPAAKVLVITSLGQKILADDALRFGARCFLPKPFQPTDLVKLAHQALEG